MKSVLVLRHAKSSWKHPELSDHDRPLNKRGKHDAPLMGRLLKREDLLPDVIISSTAMRARATAEAIAKASGYKGEIVLNKSLYAAGPEAYLGVIHDLSDEYARVLIVGHNPGLEDLVELLTGEIHLMPTCSLAHVKFRVDKWSEIDNKIKGQIGEIWLPRDLT
ncbi:MAG: histidine phosphatase family protein [Candidatus Nitrosopolaris sp.]